MKSVIFLCSLLFINSLYTEEQIRFLQSKVTKKVSLEDGDLFSKVQKKFTQNEQSLKTEPQTIQYDPLIIDQIIEKLGVNQTFNFFESTGCPIVIKDQESCGSCWSFSSTTSLAYRYFLEGVHVNLSPQFGLDCYLRDCETGNFIIDAAMHLVKNGTVTEECLPYSSGDGEVKNACTGKCIYGSEYKKYYAKDAYMTEDFYSPENFYDIVTIMIYQLVHHGPIVTGFQVFDDFFVWSYAGNKKRCHEEAYAYNGTADYAGGHAVTIAGYGKIGSKYYWLIQNSWGPDSCDNGFVKIEMGQVGVEQVAFVEPYTEKQAEVKEVEVKYEGIDEECSLIVSPLSDINDWVDTLEIGFSNPNFKDIRNFTYQCSVIDLPNGKEPHCYWEYWNSATAYKGNYKYEYSGSLGKNNLFNLEENQPEFYWYGWNTLSYLIGQVAFISQEGSSITFYYDYTTYGIETNFPPVFANKNSSKALSECKNFDFDGFTLYQCTLKKDEVDYFDSMLTPTDSPMVYSSLCGYKESTDMIVMKLDTTRYPVFHIKKLIVPENGIIYPDTKLTLVMDVEGSVKETLKNNLFYDFVYLEKNGKNISYVLDCFTSNPKSTQKDLKSTCLIELEEDARYISFDKIYVTPVYLVDEIYTPYDIIITDTFIAEKSGKPEPTPLSSGIIKNSVLLIALGLLILL